MAMTLWRPMSELAPLRRDVGTLFDRFFGTPFFDLPAGGWVPALEVTENANEVLVTIELPGVDEKNVSITLIDGNLVIKGEKETKKEEKDELCYCSERSFGTFERVIGIPTSVDGEKVKASYEKGILTVTLPKHEEAKPKEVKIEVK